MNIQFKIYGEFKAILYNEDGSIAKETDWEHNLIVNNGLIIYGTSSWWSKCTIGSDNTAPVNTDTTIGSLLGTHVASSSVVGAADYPNPVVGPNYERWSIRKWRFVAGNGTGIIREFTLGMGDNGTNIFCRHVLSSEVTKGASQIVDIFYRFYVYPELTPTTGSVLVGGVNYDWECSNFNLTARNTTLFVPMDFNLIFSSFFKAYDGAKAGVEDTTPTGDSATGATKTFLASGSGYEDWRFNIGLDDCNTDTNKITVITIPLATGHKVQCTFEATDGPDIGGGIPKDYTKEMTASLKILWSRYP